MDGLDEEEREALRRKLREEFPEHVEETGGENFRIEHSLRVHRYVVKLMQRDEIRELGPDGRVVEAAALLHDVGKAEEVEEGVMNSDGDRHAREGAPRAGELASGILDRAGIELLEQVVRNHHSEPETVEGKVLQDADELGKFGVLDVWRMVTYASEHGETFQDVRDYFWDHYVGKKEEMIEDLEFECSREVARQRLDRYRELVEEMELERRGEDIRTGET
ncbi:MAG: HD domain-containing protein [Candidatus Nanohaloarchaea archaeon]